METNLVFEGVKFMILGMGTVLLFLVLMIFLMSVMSKIIQKYFPEPHQAPTPAPVASEQSKLNKIAAITAAIMHHNQDNK